MVNVVQLHLLGVLRVKRPYSPPRITKYRNVSELPEHLRRELVDKLITLIDEHRTYRFVSESFAQAIGYRPEELIGKRVDDITVEKSVDLDFVFKAFLALGEMDGLWLCKHRNGGHVLFHYHARVTFDGLYAEAEPLPTAA